MFARAAARPRGRRARRLDASRHGSGSAATPGPGCLYDVLRVSPRASREEIRVAFREAARRLHPDAAPAPGAGADARTDAFVRAVAAYEILARDSTRAAYDAERRATAWTRGGTPDETSRGFAASVHRRRRRSGGAEGSNERTTPDDPLAWSAVFADSEILRDYRDAVDALVPRASLRADIFAAFEDVILGPELDVDAVRLGLRWPRYFEAEERALAPARTNYGAPNDTSRGRRVETFAALGVDLMHVVSGRDLLAAVRERRDARIEAGNPTEPNGNLIAGRSEEPPEGPPPRSEGRSGGRSEGRSALRTRPERGRKSALSREEAAPPDAVLELALGARVVATATRLAPGGDVIVRETREDEDGDSADEDEDAASFTSSASSSSFGKNSPPRRSRRHFVDAALVAADVDNWSGRREDASPASAEDPEDAAESGTAGVRSRSPPSPPPPPRAFVVSGLAGAFSAATVSDARTGRQTHRVVAHATPLVTHLHWFCSATGRCVGRAQRAWAPPSDTWLVPPRSEAHDAGGWYFELPPGPPTRVVRTAKRRGFIVGGDGERATGRSRRSDGKTPPAEDAFSDDDAFGVDSAFGAVREDARRFGAAMGFEAGAFDSKNRKEATPIPPAVAVFTAAFRLLDRERGEEHGVAAAARRAWATVFGGRY